MLTGLGTADCMMYTLERNGQVIRLIDTPGFDDSTRDDFDLLTEIAYWLSQAYKRVRLAGIVYLSPIDAPRFGGHARRNLTMFKLLCGRECLRSVVLASTMWDKVDPQEGMNRQQELVSTDAFWGDMVKAGSRVMTHDNTADSAFMIIDSIVRAGDNMTLDIQRQLVDEGKDLEGTSAGQEQLKKYLAEKSKAESRLKKKEREFDEALQSRQRDYARQIKQEQQAYAHQISEKEHQLSAMRINVEELRKEKQAQWEREQAEIARKRKKVEETIHRVQEDISALLRNREADRSRAEKLEAELREVAYTSQRNADAIEHARKICEIERNRMHFEYARQQSEHERQRLQVALEDMRWQQGQLVEAEMLKQTKRGTRWGAVGGVASVASVALALPAAATAAMACSVM